MSVMKFWRKSRYINEREDTFERKFANYQRNIVFPRCFVTLQRAFVRNWLPYFEMIHAKPFLASLRSCNGHANEIKRQTKSLPKIDGW